MEGEQVRPVRQEFHGIEQCEDKEIAVFGG